MERNSALRLECIAIGSLPHKDPDEAISLIKKYFANIPFWAQLTKKSKKEDMMLQYLEGMPSFCIDSDGKVFLDNESDEFFENLEAFFMDFEEILSSIDSPCLDKYGISDGYSSTFKKYLDLIKASTPKFAKGQIVGPFTLATALTDKNGQAAIYDETLTEIIIKTLILKALWQIKKIKMATPDTTPIIFIDEPSVSQLGTSAFLTISEDKVRGMIEEICNAIKTNGGICAIHCCGKCDWRMPIKSGIDIINLDAFSFAKNLSLFSEDVNKFLESGGKIAWGIIPTLDSDALEKMTVQDAIKIFETSVKYLTEKGINEKLVIDNSIVTPSCGAGGLSEELAQKALKLTKELSEELKERYSP